MKMGTRTKSEPEHDFTLVLSGPTELTTELEDAVFEAGCDDATLGICQGRLYLTFTRTAPSLKDAVLSAIRDVKNANVGLEVLRVDECNFVTQADIARKIGRSRQLVHQYITGVRGPGGFPAPVGNITEGDQFWLWSEVASWLGANDMIKNNVLRETIEVATINTHLEVLHLRQLDPALSSEISVSLMSF
jgi:hypothetical protein